MRAPLSTLFRLAWRESRSARRRLLLYMSSISLGVAALVAIDSFAANVQQSITDQSRTLLGGDISLRARNGFTPALDSLLDSLATTGIPSARVVSFASMATALPSESTRLAQIRAVSEGYPFYGEVLTEPVGRWHELQSGPYAFVDPSLLIALDAEVGDTLQVGYARFTIRGTLTNVPGDPGIAATIGPRVFIPERYVAETQLLGLGSRAEYEALLQLPEDSRPAVWVAPLRPQFEAAGARVRTVVETEIEITDSIDQLARFLGIVGLIALMLGGIGVASGVNAFVQKKIDTVAVLRCLGASGAQVLTIYLVQAAAMGFLGAAVGAALGVGIQYLLPVVMGEFLPVDVGVALVPRAIGLGLAIGVWVAVVFALRPLLVLRRVSPLQAIRRDDAALAASRRRDSWTYITNLALVVSILLLAIDRAETTEQGLLFAGGVFLGIALLWMSAGLMSWLARRLVRPRWPYVVRQGVANLYRPASQTRSVVLALGFGSFLITTIVLVQDNLLRTFEVTAAASRGNLVFFDVQDDQRAGIDSIIRAEGQSVISETPIVNMRIAAINGLATDRYAASKGLPQNYWALRREYRSTYRDTLVATETLAQGGWFEGTASPRDTLFEVSMEADIVTELELALGDIIEWNVQGARVRTRITSTRNVDWGRFEPNFFAVFPPAAIQAAPKQVVTIAAVESDTTVARIQREVVRRYPNVSSIDLSLVRRTIADLVEKVTVTVRFLALFSLAMGIPVLFSAVAATRRDRLREGVLLKTLGATRGQIGRILLSEYALLGVLGSLTGMALAFGGAWALVTYVFDGTFVVSAVPALLIAGVMTLMAVLIGVLTGRDVFAETPMAALREA
ncbi:MAG TPA: FtsX-like permease family protein [Gemmatimonadaceae bacterium]|nr:FtsX-like permease family protein [Gemmatimonadaceae bacterium]